MITCQVAGKAVRDALFLSAFGIDALPRMIVGASLLTIVAVFFASRALVRLGGFNELVINRLIVAYECQIPDDAVAEGLYYGEIGASFMTHVVRMASTYDELTTSRPGANSSALILPLPSQS